VPFLPDANCGGADVEDQQQPEQAVLHLQESGLGEFMSLSPPEKSESRVLPIHLWFLFMNRAT